MVIAPHLMLFYLMILWTVLEGPCAVCFMQQGVIYNVV